jgi:short-chain fatty acids transporter
MYKEQCGSSGVDSRSHDPSDLRSGMLARFALAMTAWTERWIPDAFVFALVATVVVVAAALMTTPTGVVEVAEIWGGGFWELIPFTMQMSLVIITGYVLASSPPMGRLIRWLAGVPSTPRGAVAWVTLFALVSSWFNWGFSLAFSAVLVRQVARRMPTVDYRALAAASVLGLGSIWAQGLSGSAALQMASPGALQPRIREIVAGQGLVPDGIIGLSHTIFLWQSLVSVLVEIVVVVAVMWLATPPAARSRTAADLGVALDEDDTPEAPVALTPGTWLEHSRLLSLFVTALGALYLFRYFSRAAEPLNALTLNVVNLTFLLAGVLLHGTPARLLHAVRVATPSVWGVILQYPFYAGIAAIITGTSLSRDLAHAFVSVSTPATYPMVVAIYSAVLGVFVPSGGSKWVVEAPYVMDAAHTLRVHLGWVVASYDLGEALANLIQPFWMLPVLGVLGLKARDIMGYTFVVFVVLTPVVLLLVGLLGATLRYPL